LLALLASPSIADKEWVFRQYDHMVQINTALLPGADAAVIRIKDDKRALAVTLDGNAAYAALDPEAGSKIAVAEACRNLACVGARPIGVTNCLNFGNPEKPEVMGQFEAVIAGMSEACRTFAIPVTGGNVSFYNDTEGESIAPTPVLGVVGLIDDIDKFVRPGFQAQGQVIVLLGRSREELGGSEYLRVQHGLELGPPPRIDLAEEKAVQELCLEAIDKGWLCSSHDISEGGLAVCLAESSFYSPERLGCRVSLDEPGRPDALVFGESQSRIVVTVERKDLEKLLRLAAKKKVAAAELGETGGTNLVIGHGGREIVNLPVEQAFAAWKSAIPELFRMK
jgi:phosphoribosylformylglycinamidine (FGAM) synthase-like enzyme